MPDDDAAVTTDESLATLADALAEVGRRVRDAVRASTHASDRDVVRTEGGDDVFGVDERAEEALFAAIDALVAPRWPGRLIMEGFDDPQPVGAVADDGEEWTYLVDPVDGTRGYLAGIQSAWVVIGAGRRAA